MITAMVGAWRPGRAAVAAGVAAAALLVGVGQGIDQLVVVHSANEVARSNRDDTSFRCLDHRLHAKVAAGTPVVVGRNISLYAQRLVEWATPALHVLPTADGARYVLAVRRTAHGPCGGLDVVAQRVS